MGRVRRNHRQRIKGPSILSLVGLGEPFRTLLETLPAAAYACDESGLITYFNPQAERTWGRAPALYDPVDRFCGSFRLYTPSGEPVAHDQCWMALALKEGRTYSGCQIVIERPDGERVQVLANASPIYDEQHQLIGAVNVLVDVSDRVELEQRVREVERDYTDFFEQGSLGMHCVGPDGTILRVNQAELDMLGYRREEYEGHNISEFHVDHDEIAEILRRLSAGETLRGHEAEVRCKNGSSKFVALTSNVLWRNGEFVHTRCFSHDITRRKIAEQALRDADDRKNEFLAMLAHELRNPLAPIVSAVEFLRRVGPVDPGLDQARDIIDRQVVHMSRLVDDLLNVARITRGELQIKRESVLLEELVSRTLQAHGEFVRGRGHELTVELPDEPLYLDVDPIRASQVLSNLLVNAAKYTESGGHVKLRAQRARAEHDGFVELSVEDDGCGLAHEDLDVVFDKFVQLDRSRTARPDGLGVGLTLVRAIVEMHGGTATAHSEGVGRGSTFVVRLPITDEAPAPGPDSSTGTVPVRRILIVEDHADAADSLAQLLRVDGHKTSIAPDAASALQQAADFRPDVILLDIGLPDMDGYETCRRLREEPWGRDALIVALTGWGQEDDERRSHEAGFDHHVTKPAKPAVIQQILAQDRPDQPT